MGNAYKNFSFENFNDFCEALYENSCPKKLYCETRHGCLELEKIQIDANVRFAKLKTEGCFVKTMQIKRLEKELLKLCYCLSGELVIKDKSHRILGQLKKNQMMLCNLQGLKNDISVEVNNGKCFLISLNETFLMELQEESLKYGEQWNLYIQMVFGSKLFRIFNASQFEEKWGLNLFQTKIIRVTELIDFRVEVLKFLNTFLKKTRNIIEIPHNSQEIEILNEAILCIQNNLEGEISLNEVAENCNCSIYKLQTSFKKEKNMTVYNYIKQAKVERAKEYLLSTDDSILHIANKVGYENPSKFAEMFKHLEGISPTDYRKNNKKTIPRL